MKIYKREFNIEAPFTIEYRICKEENGFYIELIKYEKGRETEKARCFAGTEKSKCENILEALYENFVTPIHLNSIMEDIF